MPSGFFKCPYTVEMLVAEGWQELLSSVGCFGKLGFARRLPTMIMFVCHEFSGWGTQSGAQKELQGNLLVNYS